jgi:hypothetical protein
MALTMNMQDKDIFLDILSMITQPNRAAGISTMTTSEKFRYLLPAISAELIFSP